MKKALEALAEAGSVKVGHRAGTAAVTLRGIRCGFEADG